MRRMMTGITWVVVAYIMIQAFRFMIITISWKIYRLIYTTYLLGLLFPYPKIRMIALVVTVVFCLLAAGIVGVITLLKKKCR